MPSLKSWVRAVFAVYIVITIPLLTLLFFVLLRNTPRFIETGWDSLRYQARVFSIAENTGDFLLMAAAASQALLLTLAMSATVYLIYSASSKPIRALWHWSKPTPARRIAGALVTAGAATLLAFIWAPYLPFASSPRPGWSSELRGLGAQPRTDASPLCADSPGRRESCAPMAELRVLLQAGPQRARRALHGARSGVDHLPTGPSTRSDREAA